MEGPGITHDRTDPLSVAITLFSVGSSYDRYTSQIRRALSLNAHERLAIGALWSLGPLTMTELGAQIPLSRAAVTTLVDRLETEGFVARRGDVRDRRRIVVELAELTRDRMMPVLQPWIDAVHGLAGEFDEREWDVILRFSQRFEQLNHKHADDLRSRSDAELQMLSSSALR